MIRLPRGADRWVPGLVGSWLRDSGWRASPGSQPTVWLHFTDHFEPLGGGATQAQALERVSRWQRHWPRIAQSVPDSFGRPAQFTFFYPAEEDEPEVVERIASIVRQGVGDIEVHYHHDQDTDANFRTVVGTFVRRLREDHGLLRVNEAGSIQWCFVHGNWALDNSHPEGRWCGLNNELTLLRELGCRADFTLPSAPSGCQTSLVNAIYWAEDDPTKPKSHDRGTLVRAGVAPPPDALLMVQGPLTVRQHERYRVLPTLEVGELAGYALPTMARARSWLRAAPRIGNHIFLKLFGHGAQERNGAPLLEGGGLQRCLEMTRTACEERGYRVGYLTAWEVTRLIEDLSAGRCAPDGMPEWLPALAGSR